FAAPVDQNEGLPLVRELSLVGRPRRGASPRARPGAPGPPRSRSGVRRGYVFAVKSRRRSVNNSSPAPCRGFAQASRRLMVARGGRMIAAISIGIIIIVAVVIAALAIIYFVLKGSPR